MPLAGPQPHGGRLVDLRVHGGRAAELAEAALGLPAWELTRRQRCDLELLATGGFSPLRTFLDQADYESVCADMRLTSGELWPIPIMLDLPDDVVDAATAAGGLTLRARGVDVAVLWVSSAWRPDRHAETAAVFGTTDTAHPGVHSLLAETNPWYVSGRLEVLELPPHWAFRDLRHTPAEVRALMAERGWERVVAFQTRNPMHRAHQQLGVRAARDLDAHLLLNPVVGITKPGDVDPYVRVRCYRALLPTYPPGQVLLSLLPLAMRMAGPREALWHTIIRKNLGATHFIVGRDHAGPGVDSRGRPFYDPYAGQELVRSHEAELGIGVVPFQQMVYVEELGQYVPENEVRPGQHLLRISGTEQRRRLAEGEELPEWFTPPEVAAELRRAFPPRVQRGLAVLLPAELPEADRVADGVAAELREAGRRVTVLAGAAPAGDAEALAVRLLGEVLGNGGAVVITDVEGGADLGSRLVAQGFVVEVGIDQEESAVDEDSAASPRWSRLLVPADGTAELLAGLIGDHLRRTGSLQSEPASPSLGDHVGSRSV